MGLLAGVETGGTTVVVAIADEREPTKILERAEFPTTVPSETLNAVKKWLDTKEFVAMGIASFGPIDPNPRSPTYGYITTTPKPNWKMADVVGTLSAGRNVPVKFDTDVNAPAVDAFHQRAAAGKPISCCAYVTVGTGLGIGVCLGGAPVHGLLHGEGGHMSVPRAAGDSIGERDVRSLACPGWAELESMACSLALAKRFGLEPADLKGLPDSHPVWELAAHYLACMCANLILLVSPELIILGGGVMLRKSLFPKVRLLTRQYLNGYINVPAVTDDPSDGVSGLAAVIVPSPHGNDAGIISAVSLAAAAKKEASAAGGRATGGIAWGQITMAAIAGAAVAALALGKRR